MVGMSKEGLADVPFSPFGRNEGKLLKAGFLVEGKPILLFWYSFEHTEKLII